jgi:hypothetical protein
MSLSPFHHDSVRWALLFFLMTIMSCAIAGVATAGTTVPFVGCKPSAFMDGGTTSSGNPVEVNLPPGVASKLAAYQGDHFLVLAPLGWSCTYNTAGQDAEIDISPSNISKGKVHPVISERFTDVGTPSNAMHTLGVAEQLFPKLITLSDLTNETSYLGFLSPQQLINSGKIIKVVPTDHLKYLSSSIVEYTTPPQTSGIGSQFLGPWGDGISPGTTTPTQYVSTGFVGLYMTSDFSTPIENLKGLLILGIRLPDNLDYLSPYIMKFIETDFQKRKNS